MSRVLRLLVVGAVLFGLSVSAAGATVRIVESGSSRGIGAARIGMQSSTAIAKLGKPKASGRDTSYVGQVVYWYGWGKKSKGRYPLKMYARRSGSKRTVFQFDVWGRSYVTSKGVHVGTSEDDLKAAYGDALKLSETSTYRRYWIDRTGAGKPVTDFWVKGGKVTYIDVRR